MIFIKKSEKKKNKFIFFNKFLIFYFFSTLSISIVFLIFFFTSTAFKKKTNEILDHFSRAGRFEYIYIFDIGWQAFKSNFYSIKKVQLDMNFEDVLIIENYRKKAIENKTLGDSEGIPEIDISLNFNNLKTEGILRLKGERKIHFEEKNNSSYKIKLKKDNYIMGMNKFSLQKPRVRNYIHEWLLHEMSGDFDLIKLNYEFINLNINGSDQGLYVVEENFGKELIERNKRRNGPIFAFDDNMINFSNNFKIDEDNPFFEIYNKSFWNKEENILLLKTASQKLRDFINGKKSIEDTFDTDKFASFFAVIDATYTYHALSRGTLKLYYNPINGLFEPIPFDGQRGLPNYYEYNSKFDNRILIDQKDTWWVKKFFFKDEILNKSFYNKYIDKLIKISSKQYLEGFFKERKQEINKINSFIYADYFLFANGHDFGPGLYYFSKKDLLYRSKILQKRTSSENQNVQIIKDQDKNYIIRIFSKNCFKCKSYSSLTKIYIKDITCFENKKVTSKKVVIPINMQLHYINDTLVKLNKNQNDLFCTRFKFFDATKKEFFVKNVNYLNSFENNKQFNLNSNLFQNYFKIENKNLFLKDKITIIDRNIFIPKNYTVVIKAGQKIILKDNAFIFSNSPWLANGEREDKIEIGGYVDNFGGGLIVKETDKVSHFKNVEFQFLNGLKKDFYSFKDKTLYTSKTYYLDGFFNNFKEKIIEKKEAPFYDYNLMGSINFYKTNIKLENIKIEKISSEDAINVIDSNFKIKNITFNETGSDSIDFDFSKGTIENASFNHIGNDAIDFSGSEVILKNASFFKVNDKVISVGENSNVDISDIKAFKSYVGIAAKDGSKVQVKSVKMDGVKIPFSSFIKKFEYKEPSLFLKDIEVNNYLEKWIVDKKSNIYFENEKVGKITKDIIPIIYRQDTGLIR